MTDGFKELFQELVAASIKGIFEFSILNYGLKFYKAANADGRRVPPSKTFRTAHTFCEFVIEYIGVLPLLSAVNQFAFIAVYPAQSLH